MSTSASWSDEHRQRPPDCACSMRDARGGNDYPCSSVLPNRTAICVEPHRGVEANMHLPSVVGMARRALTATMVHGSVRKNAGHPIFARIVQAGRLPQ